MERTAKYSNFSQFMEKYENYTQLLKKNLTQANQFYHDIFWPLTYDGFKNNGLNIKALFDILSVKYKNLDGENNFLVIFTGEINNKSYPDELIIENFKAFNKFSLIGDPLESIVFVQPTNQFTWIDYAKCLTFFSQAQKKWRDFHAQLETINIDFNQEGPGKSFPPEPNYFISIHSPNHHPQFLLGVSFMRININEVSIIKYSELKIQRLGKGYDTDCHSYNSHQFLY